MSRAGEQTNRKVRWLAGAYAAGLISLIILITVVDSRLATGIAVFWIMLVLLYARRTLRCPLCGASVLNAPVGAGLGWVTGRDRRCARCRTEYEAALREAAKGGS